jgi:hypothetical protein
VLDQLLVRRVEPEAGRQQHRRVRHDHWHARTDPSHTRSRWTELALASAHPGGGEMERTPSPKLKPQQLISLNWQLFSRSFAPWPEELERSPPLRDRRSGGDGGIYWNGWGGAACLYARDAGSCPLTRGRGTPLREGVFGTFFFQWALLETSRCKLACLCSFQ